MPEHSAFMTLSAGVDFAAAMLLNQMRFSVCDDDPVKG
jgi:hypothetical protein